MLVGPEELGSYKKIMKTLNGGIVCVDKVQTYVVILKMAVKGAILGHDILSHFSDGQNYFRTDLSPKWPPLGAGIDFPLKLI